MGPCNKGIHDRHEICDMFVHCISSWKILRNRLIDRLMWFPMAFQHDLHGQCLLQGKEYIAPPEGSNFCRSKLPWTDLTMERSDRNSLLAIPSEWIGRGHKKLFFLISWQRMPFRRSFSFHWGRYYHKLVC